MDIKQIFPSNYYLALIIFNENLVKPLILLLSILCCGISTCAQTTIELSTGYRFVQGIKVKESFKDLGLFPSTWLSFSKTIDDKAKLGFTLMYNEDNIVQTWPNVGDYRHHRMQIGLAFTGESELYSHKRYAVAMNFLLGVAYDKWTLRSTHSFLEENVYPKEYKQRIIGMVSFKQSFAITDHINTILDIGVGENNARLGINYTL